jgi:hypothetical protein
VALAALPAHFRGHRSVTDLAASIVSLTLVWLRRMVSKGPLFLLSIDGKFKWYLPNVLGVLANGPVGGEPRHSTRAELIAEILRDYERYGDAMRYLNANVQEILRLIAELRPQPPPAPA